MSSIAPEFPPEVFRLSAEAPEALTRHLRQLGVLDAGERIHQLRPPGAGNMNVVLRAVTDRRSLVVKQAVPWVVKYPQFAAPWDRALREQEFYALIRARPALAGKLPRLLAADPAARLLVLEDLGTAADLTGLYQGGILAADDSAAVADFLTELHAAFRDLPAAARITNREMRALNAPHLFTISFSGNNGLNLDPLEPGLAAVAAPLKADEALKHQLQRLEREHYLTDGPALLHGDCFPGCLLTTSAGLRVIDPEFCFFGPPEFDLGVWLGHLLLARQSPDLVAHGLRRYRPGAGWMPELMARFAGVEILRRLLGYAQLPLPAGLAFKRELVARGRELVLTGNPEILLQPLRSPS